MGAFYSVDVEWFRIRELELMLERERLGESVGRFLLRGRTPHDFAKRLFGDALNSLNARLAQFPELGIVDAESLAAAIERLIDWKSLVFVAAWPEVAGQIFDAQGQLLQTIRFHDSHPNEQAWHAAVDSVLVDSGFVRAAPWDDSGTRVVPV